MAGERHLYQRLSPRTWPDHLCEELRPVLTLIQSLEDNPVAALGQANIKAPELVAVLARPPSSETLQQVEAACAGVPGLIFTDEGVACGRHYGEIDWSSTPPRPQGWLVRLGAYLGFERR